MACAYERAGFRTIVATPHWISGTNWMPHPQEIFQKTALLNQELQKHVLKLNVVNGMEVGINHEIESLLSQGEIIPLRQGPYLLIESPFQYLPLRWEQIFFSVLNKGYKIILAHPERCNQIAVDSSVLQKILSTGIYFQVNYNSLLGFYGKKIQKTAFSLIMKGHVHCLATDSHDATHRSPESAFKALNLIKKLIGPESTDIITRQNPTQILAGKEILSTPILTKKATKWKQWFHIST